MRAAVALIALLPFAAHAQDGGAAAPKTVAAFTLMRDQVEHPTPRLPQWFVDAFANESVSGTYKVCVGNDGHVVSVKPIVKLGYVDDDVMRQIQSGWIYKPQPVPVCFVGVVKFQINGAGPPQYRLPTHFRGQILAMPLPALSSAVVRPVETIYRVCFATDGTAIEARRIAGDGFDDNAVRAEILKTWRLEHQPAPACLAAPLRWTN